MGLFDGDRLGRVALTLGQVGAVAMVVLVLTGVPLAFAYDPDGSGLLSGLHSMASALLLGCAAGLVACVVGAGVRRSRTWVGWPLAIAGFVAAGGGAVSGQFVRWTAVRPPDDGPRGLLGPLGDGVDAVVVGGGELSPTAFVVWAVVHVVVVSAALAGVAWWFGRSLPAAEPGPGVAGDGDGADAPAADVSAVVDDERHPGGA